MDPSDLEGSLYEFWEIILLMIPSPPIPLFFLWNFHYLEIGPPVLSLHLVLFSTIFISLFALPSGRLPPKFVFQTIEFKNFVYVLTFEELFFCLFLECSCPCVTVAVSSVSEDIEQGFVFVFLVVVAVVVCFGLYLIKVFPQKSDNP